MTVAPHVCFRALGRARKARGLYRFAARRVGATSHIRPAAKSGPRPPNPLGPDPRSDQLQTLPWFCPRAPCCPMPYCAERPEPIWAFCGGSSSLGWTIA
jgi:hypothetical protein